MIYKRLNIAHVGTISRFLSNPGKEHWNAMKWIFGYLRGTSDLKLCLGGDKPTLMGYSGSNMMSYIYSKKSTSDYLIKFVMGVMAWQSRL